MNRLMTELVVISGILLGAVLVQPAQAFDTGRGVSNMQSGKAAVRRPGRSHAHGRKISNGTRKQKNLVGLLLPAVQSAREAPRPSTPPPGNSGHDDCMSCD